MSDLTEDEKYDSDLDMFTGGHQGLGAANRRYWTSPQGRNSRNEMSGSYSDEGEKRLREMLNSAKKAGDNEEVKAMQYFLRLRKDPDNAGAAASQ